MRTALIALALIATPALAAEAQIGAVAQAPELKAGTMLRDANNYRLGAVNRVNADGSVAVIIDARLVTIPAASLSVVEGKAQTSLTKREVISLK